MAKQGELFGVNAPVVSGHALVPDTVTAAEEARLAARIDAAPLAPFEFGQWRGKRLTANYGSAYDYQRGRIAEAPPLPEWIERLRAGLHLCLRAAHQGQACRVVEHGRNVVRERGKGATQRRTSRISRQRQEYR